MTFGKKDECSTLMKGEVPRTANWREEIKIEDDNHA